MNRVVTTRADQQTAHAYWTVGRGNGDRAFRAARRHSRLVRLLRVVVPVAVIAGLSIMFLITYFNPLRMLGKLPINIDNLVVSGTKITMEQPRLSGFTRDGRAYELTAVKAAQDFTHPDIVELQDIHAKVQMQDKTTMEMTAADGVYDTKGEILKLGKDIVLTSSTGYKGRLSEAVIDTRKGNITSKKPVEVELLQGTLNANGLEVVDSGAAVRFNGGVNMVLMLDGSKPPAGKAKN